MILPRCVTADEGDNNAEENYEEIELSPPLPLGSKPEEHNR